MVSASTEIVRIWIQMSLRGDAASLAFPVAKGMPLLGQLIMCIKVAHLDIGAKRQPFGGASVGH